MLLESFILLGLSAGSISFWYYVRDLYLNEKIKIKNFNNAIPPGYSEIDSNETEINDNPEQSLIPPPPSYDR